MLWLYGVQTDGQADKRKPVVELGKSLIVLRSPSLMLLGRFACEQNIVEGACRARSIRRSWHCSLRWKVEIQTDTHEHQDAVRHLYLSNVLGTPSKSTIYSEKRAKDMPSCSPNWINTIMLSPRTMLVQCVSMFNLSSVRIMHAKYHLFCSWLLHKVKQSRTK